VALFGGQSGERAVFVAGFGQRVGIGGGHSEIAIRFPRARDHAIA
jgi:hypothetical protein